jgi:hypothetical protein
VSRAALRHVLEDVCRFDDGSAVLAVFRRGVGLSSVGDLCDMTEEEATDWVLREEEGGAGGGTGSSDGAARDNRRRLLLLPPTFEQRIEIKKLQTLRMWRSHLRRERGGVSPKDGDWLTLTSDDFEEFRAMVHGAPLPNKNNAGTSRFFAVDAAAQGLARDFLESVLEQPPEPIEGGDGMLVMRGVVKLETGEKADVVIRRVTRPFWQACIDAVEDAAPPPNNSGAPTTVQQRRRVCAVGTPGIGKTACTPYLIKMLLEQKKTVVYRVRSEDNNEWIYEFVPGSGEGSPVTAKVYPAQAFSSGVPSLSSPSTFYVVDPGKYDGSCDPDSDFRPKVIIVASPDSKHWGANEFYKNRDGVRGVLKFFPVWELDEILQASPVLSGPTMTAEQVRDRYSRVGGVPRDIFDDDASFEEALRRQDRAVRLLSAQQIKEVSVKFAVEAIVEDTFETSQPKSALIGYRVSADDRGAFSDYIVEVIATHAFARIVRRFMEDMWQDLILPSAGNPWLFEIYTRYLIASKSTSFKCRRGVGKRDRGRKSVKTIAIGGGCTEVRLSGDIIEAAKKRQMVVFHSIRLSNRLIDFLYQDTDGQFHAFQATLAETHAAKADDIVNLERMVGGHRRLSLYYLVPESRFDAFVTDPVNPRLEGARCRIFHVAVADPRRDCSSYGSFR